MDLNWQLFVKSCNFRTLRAIQEWKKYNYDFCDGTKEMYASLCVCEKCGLRLKLYSLVNDRNGKKSRRTGFIT